MAPPPLRRSLLACLALAAVLLPGRPLTGHADLPTVSVDSARDGWDGNEPALSAGQVTQSSVVQLASLPVTGVVYAQPVAASGMVVVATETNDVYGFDESSLTQRWHVNLGTFEPASQTGCTSQVSPNLGVTATPVVDAAAGVVYLTARTWDGSNASSATWRVHRLNLVDGSEPAASGWPLVVAGSATNAPSVTFDPVLHQQRPGLLLQNGVVYAAFASFCDIGAYRGWVDAVTVSTRTQKLWTTEETGSEGGIWQSGGGLVADAAGHIYAVVGNGTSPPAGPGTPVPGNLGNAVVRLDAQSDGSVAAADFFAPHNAQTLSNQDLDVGSAGAAALPDSFGVTGHPHLLVTGSKSGTVFLLDRDSLGGEGASSDTALAEAGPFESVFGHPAVWPGDGGYVYIAGSSGPLRAYRVAANGSGGATLTNVGLSGGGSYGWGSPVVTSTGTTAGSALVWIAVKSSSGDELRAYAAVPSGTTLTEVWHAPVGTATKFSVPMTDSGRIFLGTADGHLLVFGHHSTVGAPGRFTSLTPARIADTRVNSGFQGQNGRLGPGGMLTIAVAGQGNVPASGVADVVLNVTATGPSVSTYLSVFPAGGAPPGTSNLNVPPGVDQANLVAVALGTGGGVSIFNNAGSVDVVVDVEGYVDQSPPAGAGLFTPLPPARLYDSRPGSQPGHDTALGPGGVDHVQVTGMGGVPPTGVGAVVLNLTATDVSAPSYLTAYPEGGTRASSSTLNPQAHLDLANRVIVPVGAGGMVDVFNNAGTLDIVVDVVGWFTDSSSPSATGAQYQGLLPARICDTRAGTGTPCSGHRLVTGSETLHVPAAGAGGVPEMSGTTPPRAVVLNVTAAGPDASSYLVVHPGGTATPPTSDLNFPPLRDMPNLVVVGVGADGSVIVDNHIGGVDVVIDVVAYLF